MKFRIVSVGEILWDLLPGGKQLGGAPANFAYHAHALGADSLVVSCVGQDVLGDEILERLRRLGLRTDGIVVTRLAPTGTVGVALEERGQHRFTIHENVAWDRLEVSDAILREAAGADVVCFGTLGQRHPVARAAIRQVARAVPASALRILDINLRQHFFSKELIHDSLCLANVLKLNHDELPVICGLLGLGGDETTLLGELAHHYQLRAVALTKGERGSTLLAGGWLTSRSAAAVPVVDTVGAGDAYTAALALGLLAGDTPERILEHAHRVAEFVCTQPGATPALPDELLKPLTRLSI